MNTADYGLWWAWPAALALYAVFRCWYDNWRGPLRAAEIDTFMAQMRKAPSDGFTDPAVLRAFLEADDGREFVMCNLVGLHRQARPHPETGEPTSALALIRHYVRHFVPVLVRHGGHPLIGARKVGGYLDSWETPLDPGWSMSGLMRYRSRRDMMKLALDPALVHAHPFKKAATATTFSFPTQIVVAFALRPRVWVALVLALAASLAHLASLLLLIAR